MGGLWALLSFFAAGAFIFAGAIGGGSVWFMLGLLSWVFPPTVTIMSFLASASTLARRYKVAGIINVTGSVLILTLLLLFILGIKNLSNATSMLTSIAFFWMGPFILLLTSGICGLTSLNPSVRKDIQQVCVVAGLTYLKEESPESTRLRQILRFNTKELALVSVLSSLWIASEIYLGPVVSQITQVHGVIQRFFGWFLMLTLAWLTGKFGRVTATALITSSATRLIRPGQVYSLFVGFGYALGGLMFDLLYFLPYLKNLNRTKIYLLGISLISGTVALIPYLLFRLWILGLYGFALWIPLYSYTAVKSVALNLLGTLVAIPMLPRMALWATKIRGNN